jgi:altronate dehydratase small subunit
MTKRLAIRITPKDNVVTLVEEADAGDRVQYVVSGESREVEALDAVPFGHKVAIQDIPAGEPVLKYCEAIGRASKPIKRGEHVHVHNVQSAVQGGRR